MTTSSVRATKPLLTEGATQALLARVEPIFVEAHVRAWQQWKRLAEVCAEAGAEDLLLPLTPTTRANFLNNHCIANVVNLLGPLLDVTTLRLHDGWGFTAVLAMEGRDAALVRFKLLDGDLRTSNVSTGQQRMLDRQEWYEDLLGEIGLEGTNPPTVVSCGYILNDDESAIASIYIVCRQNGSEYWSYPIYGEATGIVADIPLPDTPPRVARVISKTVPPPITPATEGKAES